MLIKPLTALLSVGPVSVSSDMFDRDWGLTCSSFKSNFPFSSVGNAVCNLDQECGAEHAIVCVFRMFNLEVI